MTANKVIEYVDGLRPNAYEEEVKLQWISDLDGMVKRLVFQEKEVAETLYKEGKITEEEYNDRLEAAKVKPYVYPDDMDKELLIPPPFDSLYSLYLESMIDYYNREYSNYNNSAAMFEARLAEYKKAYIREHRARG